MSVDDLNETGKRIIQRLHVLIGAVLAAALVILIVGTLLLFMFLRRDDRAQADRDSIDARNIEVTIIVGKCLVELGRAGTDGIDACVAEKLRTLSPRP